VEEQWARLPEYFDVWLDAWVVMPNHFHGIIVSKGQAFAKVRFDKERNPAANASSIPGPNGTKPGSLGAMVQNFKSVTSRKINQQRRTPGAPVWLRNYYEHIIRNEEDWQRIHDYILSNPSRWREDRLRE
jgi:putative transposase